MVDLRGTIRNIELIPVSGVRVQLHDSNNVFLDRIRTTDSKGRYDFTVADGFKGRIVVPDQSIGISKIVAIEHMPNYAIVDTEKIKSHVYNIVVNMKIYDSMDTDESGDVSLQELKDEVERLSARVKTLETIT